jgi:hypothetical protein
MTHLGRVCWCGVGPTARPEVGIRMTGGGRDELGRLLGLLLASCCELGRLLGLLLASCGKLLRQLGGRQRHWLEAASTGNRSIRPKSSQIKDEFFLNLDVQNYK